jgi:hypothetical protein
MGTEGDSFFAVFESADDAVGCCVAAQRALAGYVVSCGDPELLATTLEMSAANAQLGEARRAARLTGAVQAVRHKTGIPVKQPELLERFLAPARAAIAPEQWDAELAAGRALTQQQAAALLGSGDETPSRDLRDMAW